MQTLDKTRLAELLRGEREARDLTLKEVAERSGLSISYISDIERARTMPSIETLSKLADVYGEKLMIGMEKDGASLYELDSLEWGLIQAVRRRDLSRIVVFLGGIMANEIKSLKL